MNHFVFNCNVRTCVWHAFCLSRVHAETIIRKSHVFDYIFAHVNTVKHTGKETLFITIRNKQCLTWYKIAIC